MLFKEAGVCCCCIVGNPGATAVLPPVLLNDVICACADVSGNPRATGDGGITTGLDGMGVPVGVGRGLNGSKLVKPCNAALFTPGTVFATLTPGIVLTFVGGGPCATAGCTRVFIV